MLIKIEKIVYPGKALGRGQDGIATFVADLLPGEVAEVEILKDKKTFREARVQQIINPSEKRCRPKCPLFHECGGCNFQHTDYAYQLALKETYLKEQLRNLKIEQFSTIVRSPIIWHYRNKFEFSFFQESEKIHLGLHRSDNQQGFLSVPFCHIAAQAFCDLWEPILKFVNNHNLNCFQSVIMRKSTATGQIMLNFVIKNACPTPAADIWLLLAESLKDRIDSLYSTSLQAEHQRAYGIPIHIWGEKNITEKLKVKHREFSFQISPLAFFQTNSKCAELMFETIHDLIAPSGQEVLIDMYCGSGAIGLTLAPYVKRVLGIEIQPEAIIDAAGNKELNQIDNIAFQKSSVSAWLKSTPVPQSAVLIVDPPRAGLDQAVLAFIQKTRPAKMIYVSCDPATLARDLKILREIYKIRKVVPLDLFPQTYHLETVCLLHLN